MSHCNNITKCGQKKELAQSTDIYLVKIVKIMLKIPIQQFQKRGNLIEPLLIDNKMIEIFERHKLLKWNGWGYKDSRFEVDKNTLEFSFTGDRYKIGNKKLPLFRQWVESTLQVDLTKKFPSQVYYINYKTNTN